MPTARCAHHPMTAAAQQLSSSLHFCRALRCYGEWIAHMQVYRRWLIDEDSSRAEEVNVACQTLTARDSLCYRQRQVSLSGAWAKLQPTAQTQSQEPINRFQSAWFAKYKGTLSNDNKVSQLSVFMWH